MKTLVITAMRNEGAYLLEWVTWYRMLGFTDILVFTNDCTDHSPALLDALAAAGWLTHVPHRVAPDRPAQRVALRRALAHPLTQAADWVFTCDVDEFLLIHRGAGRLADLLPPGPAEAAPFLGMAVNWRVFGTSGYRQFAPGLVHRQYDRCAWRRSGVNRWMKSLFRAPARFARLEAHGPLGYQPLPGTRWGEAGQLWVNSAGLPIPEIAPDAPYRRQTSFPQMDHAVAQLNHYMIRAEECFDLKRGQPSAASHEDRYTSVFFERYNRNEGRDTGARRHGAAFDALRAEAMALPGVARLHHLCTADYIARLAALTGQPPAADARWQRAMQAARACAPA